MYVRKAYGYIIFEDQSFLLEKGKLDSFDPTTVPSAHYKNWVATIDARICVACRSLNRKIYKMGEIAMPQPPLHPNCRCRILPWKLSFPETPPKMGKTVQIGG